MKMVSEIVNRLYIFISDCQWIGKHEFAYRYPKQSMIQKFSFWQVLQPKNTTLYVNTDCLVRDCLLWQASDMLSVCGCGVRSVEALRESASFFAFIPSLSNWIGAIK